MPGDDDHHHADGEDQHVGVLLDQAGDVVRVEQPAVGQDLEQHDDHGEGRHHRRTAAGSGSGTSPATRCCCSAAGCLAAGTSVWTCSLRCSALLHGHVAHQRFLGRLRAGDLAGDAPLAHRVDPVADPEQFGQLGGDDDDGFAGVGERVDDLVDLVLRADVDAAGRLVEDENVRLGEQPLAEDDLLLVAAGELPGGNVDAVGLDVQVPPVPVRVCGLLGARRRPRAAIPCAASPRRCCA